MKDLTAEIQNLKKSLQMCQSNAEENDYKSRQVVDETLLKLSKTEAELDSVKTEKDRLNELCQNHSR